MLARVRSFARLGGTERWTLVRAWLLLPAAAALLRRRSLGEAQSKVARLGRLLGHRDTMDLDAARVRLLVAWAARLHPWKARCLPQAVVTESLAGTLTLEIGVSRISNGLKAHAWVENAGQPVGEPEEVLTTFRPLGIGAERIDR